MLVLATIEVTKHFESSKHIGIVWGLRILPTRERGLEAELLQPRFPEGGDSRLHVSRDGFFSLISGSFELFLKRVVDFPYCVFGLGGGKKICP